MGKHICSYCILHIFEFFMIRHAACISVCVKFRLTSHTVVYEIVPELCKIVFSSLTFPSNSFWNVSFPSLFSIVNLSKKLHLGATICYSLVFVMVYVSVSTTVQCLVKVSRKNWVSLFADHNLFHYFNFGSFQSSEHQFFCLLKFCIVILWCWI